MSADADFRRGLVSSEVVKTEGGYSLKVVIRFRVFALRGRVNVESVEDYAQEVADHGGTQ